jgi:hypothetical protein
MGDDTVLCKQKTAIGLIQCHEASGQAITRKARPEFMRIEDLMGEMVDVTGGFGA